MTVPVSPLAMSEPNYQPFGPLVSSPKDLLEEHFPSLTAAAKPIIQGFGGMPLGIFDVRSICKNVAGVQAHIFRSVNA